MGILLLIVGLALFIGLIITHEMGHFWAARRGGVDIEEFGIFFPPRLYKKRMKKGWDFTINLLPLGGFVKLKGEHDSDTDHGSFGAASLATKTKIMAAGVVVNLATAYLLFLLLALIGMPNIVDNQFNVKSDTIYTNRAQYIVHADAVEKGSPAAVAGIRADDTIKAVGPTGHLEALSSSRTLSDITKKYSGQTVQVEFTHAGSTQQKSVKLRSDKDIAAAAKAGKSEGRLGITAYPSQDGLTTTRATWSAPIVAGGVMGQLTALTFQGLGKALGGLGSTIAGGVTNNTPARQAGQVEASSQVSGPVGIFFVFKYGSELGFKFILMVVAVLALTLGVMNILPIPALDGGRLWITLVSHALKRPLKAKTEELVNAIGFMVLLSLIVLVSIVDVKRFF